MKVLPVVNNDGSWVVAVPVPESAISTALSPTGCVVYEPGDVLPEAEQPHVGV